MSSRCNPIQNDMSVLEELTSDPFALHGVSKFISILVIFGGSQIFSPESLLEKRVILWSGRKFVKKKKRIKASHRDRDRDLFCCL